MFNLEQKSVLYKAYAKDSVQRFSFLKPSIKNNIFIFSKFLLNVTFCFLALLAKFQTTLPLHRGSLKPWTFLLYRMRKRLYLKFKELFWK